MRTTLGSALLAALLPLTTALLPTTAAVAAPLPQDDAGTGRDAPGFPMASFRIEPGRVYSGTVDGPVLDKADWYAFDAPAGAALEALGSGAFACVRLTDAGGAELARGCSLAAEAVGRATAVATTAGTYYVEVTALQPDAYRFSVGVGAPAPSPAPVGLLPVAVPTDPPPTPVAPVSAATTSGEHAVVAVIGTGINPYHEFFRAPGLTAHPSGWLPTFPASATPVSLSLGAPDYATAATADAATLGSLARSTYDEEADSFDERLYTFPGTRIVGALSFSRPSEDDPALPDRPVLDDYGDGTESAGLAAGAGVAAADGNVLVVAVEASITSYAEAARWVARQPWIDAVVVSGGLVANVPVNTSVVGGRSGMEWATREVAANGKPVLMPAGGIITDIVPDLCSTYTDDFAGPAWVTRVGNRRGTAGPDHCVPVDAVAPTAAAPAYDSMTGTVTAVDDSSAPANLAGHFAHLLLAGRRAGATADRRQVLDHLLHAARPVLPPSAEAAADTAATLAEQGYGLAGQDALDAATARLLAGSGPLPRPETEEWFARDRALRESLWGPGSVTSGPSVGAVLVHDDASSGADAPERRSEALHLAPGWLYDGGVYGGDDTNDWYAFDGAAGETFRLRHSGGSPCFTLVDPDGVAAASPSCSLAYQGNTGGAYVTFRPIAVPLHRTGTWYLRVNAVAGPTTYSFGFTVDGSEPPSILV